ncbi:putative ubiquitin carboxyl-terminal hydrolase FAF-X [Portunus trituberculatus]|uniref:Putative ubiquitin carboxyl-terminal hydrolase FAF-X n=1 Tax=Portunus trituberculatus TaxID=210409 RepID=A0A5B7F6F1_PORTR|nr:putative ubiquitin carboxyl-terminal hydrolase FAF-X [Portunus trituberculatus]
MKRVSYRRQKRWWNAYLLFYTRLDVEEDNLCNSLNELSLAERPGLIKMPCAIDRSVVRQNVRFMHSRSQFSPEYFQFLKKLIMTNHPFVLQPPQDRPIVPVGILEEYMWEVLLCFRPLLAQAILFIVVPILGPISPSKRIFGVTT